jgi:acyl-CoA thioester hydrolase
VHQPSSKPTRVALPQLADFPVRVTDVIRFGDLDRQGHVNNAVYSTYLETGRVGLIYESLQVAGATSVLARVEIDFLSELRWPGTVEIGTAVERIGQRSYRLAQAIFHDGVCAANARSTMVLIDRETRSSRALPVELIERLRGFMPAG